MKPHRSNPILRFTSLSPAVVVIVSFASSPGSHANTALNVKSGLALDAGLQTAGNYDQNLVPSATRDIIFTAAGNYVNNAGAGRFGMGNTITAGSINVLNATTALTLYNGNQGTAAPLTLSGGNSVSGTATDLLHVAAGANLTISGFKADGIVPNTVNLVLGTSGTFNVDGTALISAPIASGTITQNGTTNNLTANANALTKSGSGTLILSSALNNFTGGMTVSGGVLQLGNGGTTGRLAAGSAILNNANLTINRSNAVVQGTDFSAAAITGSGSLTQAGAGTTTLSAANTYTGDTIVNGGVLELLGSLTSNIIVNGPGTITGNGSTAGALTMNAGSTFSAGNFAPPFEANGVTFAGPTTLTFNGTPNYGQQMVLFRYGAGGVHSLNNLTSGYRVTPQDDPANSQVVGTVTVHDLTWNSTDGTWAAGIGGWSGAPSYYDGDSVTFNERPAASSITINGTVSPASIVIANTSNPYTFTGSGSISGASMLTKVGGGALTLATGNSYSGGTILEAGALNINHASALGTGPLSIYGGGFDNTSGAAVVMTGNIQQFWGADITFPGVNNLDMGRGVVVAGGEGSSRTVTVSAGTLAIGRLTSGLGLIKQGAGKLELASLGNNAASSVITGVLNVAAGELQINRTGVAAADTGDFTAAGVIGGGTITNGSAGSRWLYSNPTEGSFTFTGLLANGGTAGLGFHKSGAGTQVLTGANTYTDITTVQTGALVIGNNTALGTAAGNTTVNSGGSLQLQGGINVAEPLVTSGQGNGVASNNVVDLNPAAPGAIRSISGENTLSGTISLTSGGGGTLVRVDSGSTLNLTSGIGIINAGTSRRIFLGGAGIGNASGIISNNFGGAGVLSLEKVDDGTWTLSGINTYTGTTIVNAGTLVITGSLATGDVTVTAAGTLGGHGNIGGNVTIDAGGTHALTVAATPEAQVPARIITGSLSHEFGAVLNLSAPPSPAPGTYNLVTTTNGTITGLPDRSGFTEGTLEISPDNKTLRLVIGGGTDYDAWLSGFTFAPGADTTATGDPDGDGITNEEEHSFGLVPNNGSSLNPITSLLNRATGQFTYTRRKTSLTGLSYTYEFNTDLGGWTPFTPTAIVSDNGDPIESVTVTVPASVTDNAKAFIRVTDQ
jgi:fibronectin-binding autotransporter adhesin